MAVELALKAIAEPSRREILQLVRDGELPAGEIASHFAVTRPAISQHLRILKTAGLLTERRSGTKRLYRARLEGLEELRDFLNDFWEGRLQLLAKAAEKKERRNKHDNR
jgi:DNA-binding transcriptional ArsR family regulator